MRLSIVVIARGPSSMLHRLIAGLAAAGGVEQCEVVVGINGARLDAGDRLELERAAGRVPLQVVEVERTWPGHARNLVAKSARGDVLLFLDDDVEIPPTLLAGVMEVFADPDVGVAGGPNLTPPSASSFEHLVGRVLASRFGGGPVRGRYRTDRPAPGTELNLSLCNLAVRRETFERLEFDEALRCAEEVELLARLREQRVRLAFRPELAVFHRRRPNAYRHFRQIVKYGIGRGQVLVRRPSPRHVPFLIPVAATAALLGLAAAGARTAVGVAVLAYGLATVAAGFRLGGMRRGIQAAAVLVLTHAGYALGLVAGTVAELGRRVVPKPVERDGPLSKEAARTLLCLLAAVVGGVVAGIIVARVTGPGGRGAFELGRVVALVLAVVVGLGVGRSAVVLRARGALGARELFGAALVPLAGGVLGGVLLAIGLVHLAPGTLTWTDATLAAAAVPLIAFRRHCESALRALGQGVLFRRVLLLGELVFVAALPIALTLGRGVTAVFAAWLSQAVIGAAFAALALARTSGKPKIRALPLRSLLAMGVPQALFVLVTQLHFRIDVVVVQLYQGASEVGQYAVAFGLAELVSYGGMAAAITLFPRIAARSADDPAGGADMTAGALRTVLALSVAGLAVLVVAGPTAIRLLVGEAFAPAGTALRVLLPGVVGLSIILVLQSDLGGRGLSWPPAAIAVGGAVANLALSIVLVPSLGATGAAAASSITYLLTAAGLLALFRAQTATSLRSCLLVRREDAAMLVGRRLRDPALASSSS